ncbi:leucine-rich repeat-containing protein 9 [Bombina bombina]|uniref:leucine-rich repeat-containing protein 9 n=1 Tax=Bombina bombina TaxID=8345 RepID=UPI00235AD298|nr:leucine-rich repeat-containing protein 9 [Bombina bombina]
MFFSGYPKMVGLSYFPNLTVFRLVNQNIQQVVGLDSCPLLQELWISECQLARIEGLQHCPDLQKLYLYDNHIAVIEALESLTKLEVLWLSNNKIEVIEGLSTLQNLKELNLAGNMIRSIGESLDPNIHLERLNLSGNKISSFKEVANLARLSNLKDLGLNDPMYCPNPVCLLHNYSTHVLYHIPQLLRLDTSDVSPKQTKDLAESTVMKKKMFYNMQLKTIQRQQREELEKLKEQKCKGRLVPACQIRLLTLHIKNLERELSDLELSNHTQRNHQMSQKFDEILTANKESTPQLQTTEGIMEDERNLVQKINKKLCALKERITFWTQKLHEIDSLNEKEVARAKENFDVLFKYLQIELETVGNVRFEEGNTSHSWFKTCYDLILARYCVWNFKLYGISGVKINRIIKVHNRDLKLKFDDKLEQFMDNEDMSSSEKLLEYLFCIFDPKFPLQKAELLEVLQNGFKVPERSQLSEQGQDEAVLLSNSLSLSEDPRLEFLQKRDEKTSCDPELFKYGTLVIAKVFLGRSVPALDNLPINPDNYPNINSVFRPRKHEDNTLSSLNDGICDSQEHGSCGCCLRQCKWFLLDPELVLPEYVVEYEFTTTSQQLHPSQSSDGAEDQEHELKLDEALVNMEPIMKPKPKIIMLDEKTILLAANTNVYSRITVLNLHGNGLSKLREISRLNGLQKLVISFNDFSSLEDVSFLNNLEYLDASFNSVTSLDGFKGLGKLKHLDLSWNQLSKTREEINTLRKSTTQLLSLDIRHNPWHKPSLVHKTAVGRLRSLIQLNGTIISEGEISEALQVFAGSRITQSLLFNSRTDSTKPRCLSLLPTAQIISRISKNCPDPYADLNSSWYSLITALNFDGQNLSRITNLEKLENLRWASFSNNFLTKVEGLEHCIRLEELCLDGNCITELKGFTQLVNLTRLSLNCNQLTNLDREFFKSLQHLHFFSAEKNNISSLAGFQNAHALVELYLSSNKISNSQEIYYLKHLSNLVIMDLHGNLIAAKHEHYRLFVIFHLSSVRALDGTAVEPVEFENARDLFEGRLTSDVIAEKMGHQNFTELCDLNWKSSSVRTVDLAPIDQFIYVQTVNLENNNLTSFSGLIYLPNIKILNLNHNHIESILPMQKSHSHLTSRQILHQKVKSSGYGKQGSSGGRRDSLCEEMLTPLMLSLEVLFLGYNGITSLLPLQLNRLQNLKSLFLDGNEISQVEGLEGLQLLQELVLDRNHIKLIVENAFANPGSLHLLRLEENRLRDLSNLLSLFKLRKLYVACNKIQDISEVEKLDTLTSLQELSVFGNPISRKKGHREQLVLQLQQLQILDGIHITSEERARAQMYFLELQTPGANTAMDMGHTVSTLVLTKPSPPRVASVGLPAGIYQYAGSDLHLNNAHEDILPNDTNKYKKLKYHVIGMTNNPRSVHAETAFRQLSGGTYILPSYLSQQSGHSQVHQAQPHSQEHEGRFKLQHLSLFLKEVLATLDNFDTTIIVNPKKSSKLNKYFDVPSTVELFPVPDRASEIIGRKCERPGCLEMPTYGEIDGEKRQ